MATNFAKRPKLLGRRRDSTPVPADPNLINSHVCIA